MIMQKVHNLMSQISRQWWLLCLFCCLYYTSQLGCAREITTREVALKFGTSEASLTISRLLNNLSPSKLRRLFDKDPNTCLPPQTENSRDPTLLLTAVFGGRCRAATSVKIAIGDSPLHSSFETSISTWQSDLCYGPRNSTWQRCYKELPRQSNAVTFDCVDRKSKVVYISIPANLSVCEVTIFHAQIPAYTAAIRLVGGRTKSEGRVELFYRDSWGTVCDDSFDFNDAHVACHQLGYSKALAYERAAVLNYGEGKGPIHMDNLRCTGAETNLQDCHFNGWETHDCAHYEDVGIICDPCVSCREKKSLETEKKLCAGQFPIRLIEGDLPFIGRLEIFVRDEWGTVCNDHFGSSEATVACAQLGYQGYVGYWFQFGQSSGRIWMDDVSCPESTEDHFVTRLADCFKKGSFSRFSTDLHWGSHNCSHSQDVWLSCSTSARTLPLRLVDGGAAHKGRVEIFVNGLWGSVCDDSWSWNDAKVVCRQLGYPYATAYRTSALFGMSEHYHIWMDNVECQGDEDRVQDCRFPGWGVHDCTHEQDAGVECFPTYDSERYDYYNVSRAHDPKRGRRNANESSFKDGLLLQKEEYTKDIRLVNGYSLSEGRLEIKLDGLWTTICDSNWNINISNIVCNILGFSGAVKAFKQSYFGEGTGPIRTIDANCLHPKTFNSTLCSISSKANKSCTHANDVGLICFPHDRNMQQFIDFTEEYKKIYVSGKERNRKAAIFHSNLKMIENLNVADHFSPYGITKFMDMSEDEFAESYLMSNVSNDESVMSTSEEERHKRSLADHDDWTGPIPKCFDWRDRSPSVVTKVKDQGKCGSCWAFAAVAQIESVWALQGQNPLIELSTQQVVSCDTSSNGCNGGGVSRAMDYVLNARGIQTERRYPYRSGEDDVTRNCSFIYNRIHASITGWLRVTTSSSAHDEYDMMVYLYRRGPIAVCFNAYNLQFYSKSIVSNCGSYHRRITHSVVLTGFGTSHSGTPYWVVRNSWGEDWGDSGYFLIERNVNMCGIAQYAYASYIMK